MLFPVQAQFQLPLSEIWGKGSNIAWTVGQMISADKILISLYCDTILHPENLQRLEVEEYDVAIVDLMFNECGLALAHHLGLPSVGYWAFSFAGGVQEFTTMEALPSFIPSMMSTMGSKMTFLQRTWNMLAKLLSRSFMLYHAYMTGTPQAGPGDIYLCQSHPGPA